MTEIPVLQTPHNHQLNGQSFKGQGSAAEPSRRMDVVDTCGVLGLGPKACEIANSKIRRQRHNPLKVEKCHIEIIVGDAHAI
jgi:hypothetical protein